MRNIHIRYTALVLTAWMLAALCGPVHADALADRLDEAMDKLGVTSGATTWCVVTNAGYAAMAGGSSASAIDTIQEVTGCTAGSGRLMFYHRTSTSPLVIGLVDTAAERCVVVTQSGAEPVCGGIVEIGFDRLGDADDWADIGRQLAGDAAAIVGFAYLWAAGAPYEFMKCAEFHNHICPGVTSGYFLAAYIRDHLLEDGASYTYIACPVWCKEDAIQVLLDLTPGKKSLIAKTLTDEQLAGLADDSVAGIFIVTGDDGERAAAHILGFDWDAADSLAGSSREGGMDARIANMAGLVPYYRRPELVVSVLATRTISSDEAARMATAGVNPYEMLAFTK